MAKNKKLVLEKIINLVLNTVLVIFGILLMVSIYNNIQTLILGNSYSKFFGYSTFEVETGSMEDTISIGDWIIVKENKDIKVDDIITFEKDGEFITHRVKEAYKGTYVTQGDANNAKDDPITSDQVVGKVVKILPGFGIVRKILLNPIVLIAVIITLWLISYTIKSEKNSNKLKAIFKKKKEFIKEETTESEPIIEQIELASDTDDDSEDYEEEYEDEFEDIEIDDVEEFEKTMYFRMISVDKLDIDEKSIPIKEEKVKPEAKKAKKKEAPVKEEKTGGKKFKNIVEKVMFLKKSELLDITDALNNYAELKTGEKAIRDALLNDYLENKYYSKDENRASGRNTLNKINSFIKEKGNELINTYKGTDKLYKDKVNKYISIISIVNYLELTYPLISKPTEKKEAYFTKLKKSLKIDLLDSELKLIVNNIIKIQKEYDTMIKESIKGQNSSTFKLELTRLIPKSNYYKVDLDHNLEFSSVYSDYIVDKTYSEGKIAEEKTIILTNLLLTRIAQNMLENTLGDKYFIKLPSSMYEKSNKLGKVLTMTKDDYIKDNINFLVSYDNLIKYKKLIKSLRKDGYRFAVMLDDQDNIKDLKVFALSNYILANKNIIKKLNSLPEDVKQNIIETGGK